MLLPRRQFGSRSRLTPLIKQSDVSWSEGLVLNSPFEGFPLAFYVGDSLIESSSD
jgi:hypothetical protein